MRSQPEIRFVFQLTSYGVLQRISHRSERQSLTLLERSYYINACTQIILVVITGLTQLTE